MRLKPLPLAIGIVLGLAGAGCGGGGSKQATGQQRFETVTLASVNNMLHLPEFVAVQKGFFAQNGLNVKLQILTSGNDVNKALQTGQAELGGTSNTSLVAARAAGESLKAVGSEMNDATSTTYAGPLGIVRRADRGIKAGDPQSLVGKKLGTQGGTTNEEYLHRYLKANGIPLSKVKIVPLSTSDHPVSVVKGDVDAVSSWEPYVAQEVRQLGANAVVVSRGTPLIGYVIGVAATDTVIAQHPDTLQKLIAGLAQASQWIRQNRQEAAQVATNFLSGLDPQDATAAMDHLTFDPRLSSCTTKVFADTATQLAAAGTIKTSLGGGDLVDASIMSQVQQAHPAWFSDLPKLPASCSG